MDDVNQVKVGMRVVVKSLHPTNGMMINEKHLEIRRIGARGVVINWVAGHGGDVWWVEQSDGVAAYSYTEFVED